MEMIMLLLLATSVTFNVLYTIITIYYSPKSKKVTNRKHYPRISILKPVKNVDDDMENNFDSIFNIDYPDFEILFGVDSKQDPVADLIRRMIQKYPKVDVKMIETGHRSDQNPKVHKLSFMEDYASGELFWISDSNIRVHPSALKSLANEYIDNGTHLVFSPIKGEGNRTFGSIIENSYMNHYLSGNVLAAWNLFKQEIVVGKSMLIERKALNSFGGFSYFRNFLAEDQIMGETFRNSGYKIKTNNTWVTNFNNSSTMKSFFSRMSRWAKLRFNMHRNIYAIELLTNTTTLCILSLLFPDRIGAMTLALAMSMRIASELVNYLAIDRTEGGRLRSLLLLPTVVIVKDLLLLMVWFTPFISNQVNWRGGYIKIGKRTELANQLDSILLDGVVTYEG